MLCQSCTTRTIESHNVTRLLSSTASSPTHHITSHQHHIIPKKAHRRANISTPVTLHRSADTYISSPDHMDLNNTNNTKCRPPLLATKPRCCRLRRHCPIIHRSDWRLVNNIVPVIIVAFITISIILVVFVDDPSLPSKRKQLKNRKRLQETSVLDVPSRNRTCATCSAHRQTGGYNGTYVPE